MFSPLFSDNFVIGTKDLSPCPYAVADSQSSPGLNDAIDFLVAKVDKTKKETEIVNNSQYKYLIYGPTERKEFINRLENLQDMISNKDYDIYNSEVNNQRYKEYMLKNVDVIRNMNSDYKKSSEELIKYIDFMKKQK